MTLHEAIARNFEADARAADYRAAEADGKVRRYVKEINAIVANRRAWLDPDDEIRVLRLARERFANTAVAERNAATEFRAKARLARAKEAV